MHIAVILLLIWKIVGKIVVKQLLSFAVDNELFLVLQGYKVLEKIKYTKQCHWSKGCKKVHI